MKLEEFTKEKKNRNKQVFCTKKPTLYLMYVSLQQLNS